MTAPAPTLELNDDRRIPALGFGTYPLQGAEATDVVGRAIETGYRLFDTAQQYGNEDAVGRAIRESDVPRAELFVTTKLAGAEHGHESALRACEGSLVRLGLEYIDLLQIHWPLPRIDKYVDSWRAFIELRERGLVRSIGVSNFTAEQIERLIGETGVVPAVNQVELHPYFPQGAQRAYNQTHAIVTQSWSPLGRKTALLDSAVLAEIAEHHGVTAAQVVLRWHVELGAVPIPKSADPDRMTANLDVFGFDLAAGEVDAIATLDTGQRIGGDPDIHEEF